MDGTTIIAELITQYNDKIRVLYYATMLHANAADKENFKSIVLYLHELICVATELDQFQRELRETKNLF
jgi:hypothetical protein